MRYRIRALRTLAEFKRCEELQKEAWGFEDLDVVPLPMFQIAAKYDGIVLGCIESPGGRVVGFVYSLPARAHGRWVQYSHMLAVSPDTRRQGLGLRLKLAQARTSLALGFHRLIWTFDPLQARNASLNLRRLGATVSQYFVDLYGPTSSPLHRGLPTDRLLADWDVRGMGRRSGLPRRRARRGGRASPESPIIYDCSKELLRDLRSPNFRSFRFAIPASIEDLKASDPAAAAKVQMRLRSVFVAAFRAGFRAVDFEIGAGDGPGHYLLVRGAGAGRGHRTGGGRR
ncbi:MAG: GNAT family N-acetyltransferase [Acidobacteriota bacterium]